MTLSTNPSYQALAALAANALGNPAPSIIKGILAQWQCELGNVSYPPTRNNPGNIARGFAQGVGIPFTVQFPNPQPSNPIVTYATPADGARAYAGGIRMFGRYAIARAAVARGDGRGFILGLTAAGWGTNAGCALRVFGTEGGALHPGSIDATPAAFITPSDLAASLAQLLGIGRDTVLTADQVNRAAKWLSDNGYYDENESRSALTGKTLNEWADQHKAGGPLDPIANAIAGLGKTIGDVVTAVVVNGAVLVVILALAYAGLRDILEGGE